MGLFSCQVRREINDEVIYGFVNQLLVQKTPINFTTVECLADNELDTFRFTQQDSLELLKMDTIFAHEDVPFICEQMKQDSDFKLKREFIKDRKVISSDTLKMWGELRDQSFWKKLKDRYGVESFMTISKPFFSKDKSKVIITTNYYTVDGGSGETDVFRYKNGKWMWTDMLRGWDN